MNRRGFTLLEVLVATTIMGIAVAGLIAGLSQSVHNASRLTDYDRAAMLARTKMNDLLLDGDVPFDGTLTGNFPLDQSGGIPSGWQASFHPYELPPNAAPGTMIVQRVTLDVWWQPPSGSRRKIDIETCRGAPIHGLPVRSAWENVAWEKILAPVLHFVEMLIAVSLLSLLSVGMLVTMRLGFSTMDKLDTHLIANRRVANSRAVIESELNGFVFSMANYRNQPNSSQAVLFFQMEPQAMRFVTSYSLQDGWRGRPQIAVLQVIPGDAGVRLIVNETPYTGPDQAGQNIAGVEHEAGAPQTVIYSPVLPGPQSFVLADRLAYCRFSYLEQRFQEPFLLWRTALTSPRQLPRGVRIEMAPLDAASSDLHVTTVTVPLNVTRVPGQIYGD